MVLRGLGAIVRHGAVFKALPAGFGTCYQFTLLIRDTMTDKDGMAVYREELLNYTSKTQLHYQNKTNQNLAVVGAPRLPTF